MDDQQNDKILASNGLYYVMPKPLSTTLNRTYKTQYSTRSEYSSNETIVFDINTSSIIDPELSFIKFTLENTGIASLIGSGSAINFFRELRIQSRNGTELDRLEHVNDLAHYYLRNCVSKEILESKGFVSGFGFPALAAATSYEFAIPLSWISGLFRPHVKGQKMPSQLISGARFEIQTEDPKKALYSLLPGVLSYKILNPELHLMEMTQNDNTLKILVEQSANNGLEYFYPRCFTSVETSANTSVNFQIKKSVSQATHVVTVPKFSTNQAEQTADSFASLSSASTTGFSKFQYRLASNYYPNQICDSVVQGYMVSSQTCLCLEDKISSFATASTYISGPDFNVAVALKTDSGISASGLAVNNSSTVALEYESTDNVTKSFYTFLEYNALARCYLSQVTVKI